MYLPAHFAETDPDVLHKEMRAIKLASLVTLGPDGMEASHVPVLVDAHPAPYGSLRGHVARANPQWQRASGGTQALAIFLGPNAYVSPSLYPSKQQSGKVVPTWNYVAIHAYGILQFHDDPQWLLGLVTRLTDTHEAERAAPWKVGDAPGDFIQSQLRAIVGFELTLTRLEGKWKMSQNRPPQDRAGVAAGLQENGSPADAEVGRIVKRLDEK